MKTTLNHFCRNCFAAAILFLAAPAHDALAYGIIGGSANAQGGQDVVVVAATNFLSYAEAEREYVRRCRAALVRIGAPREDILCTLDETFIARFINQSAVGAYWNGTRAAPGLREAAVIAFPADTEHSEQIRRNIACSQVRPSNFNGCDETILVVDETVCPGDLEIGPEACQCPAGLVPHSSAQYGCVCPNGMVKDALGQCRAPSFIDCSADTEEIPVPVDGLPNCTACAGNTPVKTDDGLNCRAREARDCTGETPELDADSGECRAREARDCPFNTPIFAAATEECRAREARDCAAGTIFEANTEGGSGNCRPEVASDCPTNGEIPDGSINGAPNCIACTGATPFEADDGVSCRSREARDCTGATPIFENGDCRPRVVADCGYSERFENGQCEFVDCNTNTNLIARPVLQGRWDNDRNECTCRGAELEDGTPLVQIGVGTDDVTNPYYLACVPSRPPFPEEVIYTADQCTRAGWQVVRNWRYELFYLNGVNGEVGFELQQTEWCYIPVTVDNNTSPLRAASVGGFVAQSHGGQTHDRCVLRRTTGRPAQNSPPLCHAPGIFGTGGLPVRPDDIKVVLITTTTPVGNGVTVVSVRATSTGGQIVVVPQSAVVAGAPRVFFQPQQGQGERQQIQAFIGGGSGGGSGGGGGDNGGIAMGLGGAALVGLFVMNYWDGNLNAFSFAPHSSFSYNEGGAAISYGSRLEFSQDDMTAYWGARQSHTGGETDAWKYFTGLKYGKDIWNISYKSESQGVRTNMDLAAGVELERGIWSYKTGIAGEYDIAEADEDFSASWRNSVELDYQGWQIVPSADLYWRESTAAADMGITAKYRF